LGQRPISIFLGAAGFSQREPPTLGLDAPQHFERPAPELTVEERDDLHWSHAAFGTHDRRCQGYRGSSAARPMGSVVPLTLPGGVVLMGIGRIKVLEALLAAAVHRSILPAARSALVGPFVFAAPLSLM